MTRDEFNDFWGHHVRNFPGVNGWLTRNMPTKELQAGTFESWATILDRTDLVDANAASDAMARGDAEKPNAYDDHPAAIVRIARKVKVKREGEQPQRRHYADGQETVRCVKCDDDGLVIVWDRVAMAAAKEGTLGNRKTLYSCAVRCTCDAAEKWRWMQAVYNPSRMCPVGIKGIGDREEQEKLVAFMGGMKPVGHEQAFDAFGGED